MNDEEERCFRAFVAARSPVLMRTAALLAGGDIHAAEDLLQTALAKAVGRWNRLENPEAYLRRVLYRQQVSVWRLLSTRRETTVAELPDAAGREDLTGSAELRIQVRRALSRLTVRQRSMLVLRYFEDCPEGEVAELLGCSVGTVRSTTHRALAKRRVWPPLLRSSHAVTATRARDFSRSLATPAARPATRPSALSAYAGWVPSGPVSGCLPWEWCRHRGMGAMRVEGTTPEPKTSIQGGLTSLGEAACRYRADEIRLEDLPMIAAEALAAGLDTPTLCELAGWPRSADARDIRDAFERALSESGIGLPDRSLARRHALRRMAARLIDGEIAPVDLVADDWWETEVETAADQSFAALIPHCECCIEYTLGLDQQTWVAQLRNAALALTSFPPIGRGC